MIDKNNQILHASNFTKDIFVISLNLSNCYVYNKSIKKVEDNDKNSNKSNVFFTRKLKEIEVELKIFRAKYSKSGHDEVTRIKLGEVEGEDIKTVWNSCTRKLFFSHSYKFISTFRNSDD